jgi:hypothetical protein
MSLLSSWGIAPERGSFAVQVVERKQHASPGSPRRRPCTGSPSRAAQQDEDDDDDELQESVVGRFVLEVTDKRDGSRKDYTGSQNDMAIVTF